MSTNDSVADSEGSGPPSSILSAPRGKGSSPDGKGGKWVRFDADSSTSTDINEPLPPTGVAQIDVRVEETSPERRVRPSKGRHDAVPGPANPPGQFENGRLISSIKPENNCLPWLTPARFDAYKMPKSLVSDHLSCVPVPTEPGSRPGSGASANGTALWEALPANAGDLCPWLTPAAFDSYALPKIAFYRLKMPVEDYVTAMEMLTNDFRFRGYTACYRRLIGTWLVTSFLLLCVLLGAGLATGLLLFVIVLVWMFIVAVGVLGVMVAKKRIHKALHRCVASVNGLLMRHKLLVGMEDRGKLSCHKISVHFVYFDTEDCVERVRQLLVQQEQMRAARGQAASATPVASVSREIGMDEDQLRATARALCLKYSQSYIKSLIRKRLRFPSRPAEGVSDFAPLHCASALCLCQYVQRTHFDRKGTKNCCERFFLVGDQNIADLEAPAYGAGSYPVPAIAYAHM